jgi:hypothetical protein
MKFSVRLLFIAIFLSAFFFITKPAVFAQTTSTAENAQAQYLAPNNDSNVPQNLHTWTQNVLLEVVSATICQITGSDPINPTQQCLGVDTKTKQIGFVNNGGGLIGVTQNMIGMLYENPPAQSGQYFKYLASNFGITKPSYADAATGVQGLGFTSLAPLINIWTVFRNFVYIMFVVFFLVIGIAIMLRVRIDPRTVMTIQNQIPKVIIGVVLVTFSFAIAGFLVDLMYVFSYLFLGLIASADPANIGSTLVTQLVNSSSPLEAANKVMILSTPITLPGGFTMNGLTGMATLPAGMIGAFIGPLFNNAPGSLVMGVLVGFIGLNAGSAIGNTLGLVIGGIVSLVGGPEIGIPLGAIVAGSFAVGGFMQGTLNAQGDAQLLFGVIAWLIIMIAILFSLLRLWIQLLMAYVSILIDVIFAPFWIAAGILPGSKISFSSWLRDMAANLSAFPAALAMLLLSRVFIDAYGTTQFPNQFVPPLVGDNASPNLVGTLIGLGFILMTPSVVKMLKAAFKAPGMGIGAAGGALGSGIGLLVNTGKRTMGIRTASEEYRITKFEGNQVTYGKVGGIRALSQNLIR